MQMQDDDQRIAALKVKEAQSEIARLKSKIARINSRYGTGVRPSWVSADIQMCWYEIHQQEAEIAKLEEEL